MCGYGLQVIFLREALGPLGKSIYEEKPIGSFFSARGPGTRTGVGESWFHEVRSNLRFAHPAV